MKRESKIPEGEEITELNTSLSELKIKGARLPEAVLQFSGVEAPVKS